MVGLGNPGGAYAGTRHNAGRWAAVELMRRHGGSPRRVQGGKARAAELILAGRRMAVAAPSTYMNESGRAVGPLVRSCGIDDLSRLVVLHDELDLPVGRLKVKSGGGLAGHKGLKSIRACLRSCAFTRVRIGIGRPADQGGRESGVVDHVLSRPGRAERAELQRAAARAADAVECLLEHGLEAAMNRFNAV